MSNNRVNAKINWRLLAPVLQAFQVPDFLFQRGRCKNSENGVQNEA
jgi:hypothetical protein